MDNRQSSAGFRSVRPGGPLAHLYNVAMNSGRVVINRYGGPEVLQLIEEDLPEPSAGQVRLKVLATGVAFADVLMRYGMYPNMPALPFSPGYDGVGVIDKIGEGVTSYTPRRGGRSAHHDWRVLPISLRCSQRADSGA